MIKRHWETANVSNYAYAGRFGFLYIRFRRCQLLLNLDRVRSGHGAFRGHYVQNRMIIHLSSVAHFVQELFVIFDFVTAKISLL